MKDSGQAFFCLVDPSFEDRIIFREILRLLKMEQRFIYFSYIFKIDAKIVVCRSQPVQSPVGYPKIILDVVFYRLHGGQFFENRNGLTILLHVLVGECHEVEG